MEDVPLRERGVCPVAMDWTFKTASRWRRRFMIEAAYAADELRRERAEQAEAEAIALDVGELAGEALSLAARQRAAQAFVERNFPDAAKWGERTWSAVVRQPVRLHLRRKGLSTSVTLWCDECLRELEVNLNRATGRPVTVKRGARPREVVLSVRGART
jgi:hypothetical protein